MSFFQEPNNWIEWLVVAIRAERICLDRGVQKKDFAPYLAKQEPFDILKFTRRFSKYTESINTNDYMFSTTTLRNNGCPWMPSKGGKE